MKLYFKSLILVLIAGCSINAQPSKNLYFNKNGVEGVIFSSVDVPGMDKIASGWTNVQPDEVLKVDSMAKLFVIKKSKGSFPQQGFDNCPIIYKNWNEYYRQVVGYRDKKTNDEIILIQYVYKSMEKEHLNWKDQWVLVSGGCSNYWQISYNKRTQKLFGWAIN